MAFENAGDFISDQNKEETEEVEMADNNAGDAGDEIDSGDRGGRIDSGNNSPMRVLFGAASDGGSGSPTQSSIVCDDCQKSVPIRMWRWCSGCERVLCETCCVVGHYEHLIVSYPTAVRRHSEEFHQTIEEVRLNVEMLHEAAAQSGELKKDIVDKLSAVKRDMRGKFDESKDIEDTIKEQMASMLKVQREPLNAKTWNERKQSIVGLDKLLKNAFNQQRDLGGYLKRMDSLTDESGAKLGEVFREDI